MIMCGINVYTDSSLTFNRVYQVEKSKTRKMRSAEIKERRRLSNFPHTNKHYKRAKRFLYNKTM